MRRIEIDDEVYSHLEARVQGFEQPNDVLRRLLLTPGTVTKSVSPSAGRQPMSSIPGALAELIAKGPVKPGDALAHVQARKGRSFTAVVEADGWIKTDLDRYKDPSPALGKLVGTAIDGWANWTHQPSGKTLRQLRAESGGAGRGGR
ncbi:hypothetical protein OG792_21835 [Micromonospora sp. NBC_01699]|uniref:restriction system modified-DNA reader domain-containing protein n=1 Tax=Micromonospora sp. NBC_01699 TaxID=2975984 RepID=UPI002E284AD8|nr:hypothetical protein [Micromonospora sp. NBC_01699]